MTAFAVVIPAYNETATIREVAAAACQQCEQVIVVDDGSTDGTAECLTGLPVVLLRHTANNGKAASLWSGMQHAVAQGVDAVITLDGDGQHDPTLIPQLIAAFEREPGRIIIAARLRQRHIVPRARRFANAQADFWLSWASGHRIYDSQSGFRVYPAALLSRLQLSTRRRGFVFESELLIEAAKRYYYTRPVVIDAIYRPQARASYYRPWRDTLLIIRMVAWKLISRGLYLSGLWRAYGSSAPDHRPVH